ncbi:MAG: carbohydrate ABC transporter permease [Anaerolineae bacterium]
MAKNSIIRIILFGLLSILVILWLLPLIITFITALKSPREVADTYPWDLPQQISLSDNLAFAWNKGSLGESFVISLVYATGGAVGAIILASLAAFAMVQLRLKGSFFWFLVIYSGTIFPFQMYLLPLFYFYQNSSLYDTQVGLLLFYTAIAIPFCLFVMRNYFTTISPEIIESAKIDGLSNFGIYLRICMRLSLAPIAALFCFSLPGFGNDLLWHHSGQVG